MKKRLVAVLLVLVFITTMGITFTSIDSWASSELFAYYDFNTDWTSSKNYPVEWITWGSRANGQLIDCVDTPAGKPDAAAGDKAMYMHVTNQAKPSVDVYWHANGTNGGPNLDLIGKISIEAKFLLNDTAHMVSIGTLTVGGSNFDTIYFDSDGQIKLSGGSIIMPYIEDTWYTIKMIVNTDTGDINYLINGVPYSNKISKTGQLTRIKMLYYTGTDINGGIYIDDFRVTDYNKDANLSDIKIEGSTIPGFSSSITEYLHEQPYDRPLTVSDFTYAAVNPIASVNLMLPDRYPGDVKMEVLAANKTDKKTYIIHVDINIDPSDVDSIIECINNATEEEIDGLLEEFADVFHLNISDYKAFADKASVRNVMIATEFTSPEELTRAFNNTLILAFVNDASEADIINVLMKYKESLGLDLSASSNYTSLDDKAVVHSAMAAVIFTDLDQIKPQFNNIVDTQFMAEVVIGDISLDKKVDAADIVLFLKHKKSPQNFNAKQLFAANADTSNSQLNDDDLNKIIAYIMSKK